MSETGGFRLGRGALALCLGLACVSIGMAMGDARGARAYLGPFWEDLHSSIIGGVGFRYARMTEKRDYSWMRVCEEE